MSIEEFKTPFQVKLDKENRLLKLGVSGKQKCSENEQWLKDLEIRYSGRPLDRPSAKSQAAYQRRKFKKEQGMHNEIESKFGQGNNGYNLRKIRARAARTSESWIAAIFFVTNLVKFSKGFLFSILDTLFEPYILIKDELVIESTELQAGN